MKIVLASSNKKKIAELRAILSDMFSGSDIEVITLKEAGIDTEIEENGASFEENALIKAKVAASTGMIGVADDSGLVVEALDGLPPVKVHCSVLAEEAVKSAIADYYQKIGKPVDFVIESHEE